MLSGQSHVPRAPQPVVSTVSVGMDQLSYRTHPLSARDRPVAASRSRLPPVLCYPAAMDKPVPLTFGEWVAGFASIAFFGALAFVALVLIVAAFEIVF